MLCCSFDAAGGTLATGSADGEIRLWRVVASEWRCVKTLELGPAVTSCRFQPAGAGGMLCTGSADMATASLGGFGLVEMSIELTSSAPSMGFWFFDDDCDERDRTACR